MISKNNLLISSATSSSTSLLVMITPPKADMGSPASASFHACNRLSREAMPQALLCLIIASDVSSKSAISSVAASMSNRLLYDISLPFS